MTGPFKVGDDRRVFQSLPHAVSFAQGYITRERLATVAVRDRDGTAVARVERHDRVIVTVPVETAS